MDRRSPAPPPVSRACPDGARARHEPDRLGSIDNHRQEPWKAPLPEFIEHLYEKRFGKSRPDLVVTIEDRARAAAAKEAERKALKHARRAMRDAPADATAREGKPVEPDDNHEP